MKKILFVICLFTLISCKKSDYITPNLNGTWEMISTMSVFHNENHITGQGNLIQFIAGNQYKKLTNGIITSEGSYHVLKKNTKSFNKTFDAIFLGEELYALNIQSDSLYISTPPNDTKGNLIMDGGSILYIKQK